MEKYPIRSIRLSQLDPAQDRFRISFGRNTETLERSIQEFGCLDPIWAWENQGTFIVHGFRRVEIARKLGLQQLDVGYFPHSFHEKDVLLHAIELFLTTQNPNPVEQSILIHKLEKFLTREEIFKVYFPRIGLNPSPVIYQRIRSICDLPQSAQDGLAEGRLDSACVPYLLQLPGEERIEAVDLLLRLRPTMNMQKEILEYLHDITLREGVTVQEILQHSEVQVIMNHQPSNLPQQRDAFRRWLKSRRYPILTHARQAFEKTVQSWNLGEGVRVKAPPYYEGGEYRVDLRFRTLEEFKERVVKLEHVKEHPEWIVKLWQ